MDQRWEADQKINIILNNFINNNLTQLLALHLRAKINKELYFMMTIDFYQIGGTRVMDQVVRPEVSPHPPEVNSGQALKGSYRINYIKARSI
jgi:hypothetical protein